MNTKDEIRLRLIDLMDANKTSGSELAEAVGVSKQAVSNWRTGKSSIDIDNVPSICRFFGISIDDFFRSDDEGAKRTKINLSGDERELVELYRMLTAKGRHSVLVGLRDYVLH